MLTCSDSALIFKALADETRLKILDMLSCEELCACNILEAFQITQPTLSYHMKILTECGLVKGRREGSWTRYSLDADLIADTTAFLISVTTGKDDCICRKQVV